MLAIIDQLTTSPRITILRRSKTSGFPSGHHGLDFVATNSEKMTSVVTDVSSLSIGEILFDAHQYLPMPEFGEAMCVALPFQPSFKNGHKHFSGDITCRYLFMFYCKIYSVPVPGTHSHRVDDYQVPGTSYVLKTGRSFGKDLKNVRSGTSLRRPCIMVMLSMTTSYHAFYGHAVLFNSPWPAAVLALILASSTWHLLPMCVWCARVEVSLHDGTGCGDRMHDCRNVP